MVEAQQRGVTVVGAAASLAPELAALAATHDRDASFPADSLQLLHAAGLCSAPLPVDLGGVGLNGPAHRAELLQVLKQIGRGDLVAGRLYEGHVNALELICDYGSRAQQARAAEDAARGRWFGVWNSEGRDGVLLRAPAGSASAGCLQGSKIYASGAGRIDRPLLTARGADRYWQMVLIDGHDPQLSIDPTFWRPLGMRASGSYRIGFDGITVGPEALIGNADDYYREPQFSGGAVRFAAVQLGGAEAIHDETRRFLREIGRTDDPYQRMRLGEMTLAVESGNLWLDGAARHVGDVPYAHLVRSAIEQIGLQVMQLAERCTGARGLLQPSPLERMHRDLTHYLRQPAPDAVLAAAGAHVLSSSADSWRLWGR